MEVDESIVTCARTRGSMMNVLPVAAPTASAIKVMSASLKFGVMRCCCCCAGASGTAATKASAQIAMKRKPFTGVFPRRASPVAGYCVLSG